MGIFRLSVLTTVICLICLTYAFAQNRKSAVYLETFEKCNNYARHYCLTGSHEAAVNRALLDMKRKGKTITPKTIQRVAQVTPSRLANPAAQSTR